MGDDWAHRPGVGRDGSRYQDRVSDEHEDKNPPGQERYFHVRPGDAESSLPAAVLGVLPRQGVMSVLVRTLLASSRNPLGLAQPRAGFSVKSAGSGCLGQSQGTGSACLQGPAWKRPCLNLGKRAGRLGWGERLVSGGDQVGKMDSHWTTEPSKAWGRVCSEGGE